MFIILAIIAWGLWAIFEKLAAQNMHPMSIMLVQSIIGVMLIPIDYILVRSTTKTFTYNVNGIIFSALAVITAAVAATAFSYSMKKYDSNIVISYTSVYPLVAFILSVFILKEHITVFRFFGIVLIVVGTIFLGK